MPAPRRLVPADVFAFRHADNVRLSPDGARLLYIEVRRDIMSDTKRAVLMLGAAEGPFQPIAGSEGVTVARWSPDGTRIALLCRDGARARVVVCDAQGQEIAVSNSDAPLRELAWSPDATQLATQMQLADPAPGWFAMPIPPQGAAWAPAPKLTERTVWRHDPQGELPHATWQIAVLAPGGAPRPLTCGTWMSGFWFPAGLTWSADGREVLFAASNRTDWDVQPDHIALHAVAVADGALRVVFDGLHAPAAPAASPDGRWIAFVAADSPASGAVRKLRLVPAAGGAVTTLSTDLDRSVDQPAWTPDGAGVYACVEESGRRGIARFGLNGGVAMIVENVGGPGIEMPYTGAGGFSTAQDGSIAYALSTPTIPSDVVLLRPGAAARTVAELNTAIAAEVGGFQPADELTLPSSSGSHTIQAFLMLPRGPAPAGGHPMILEIHGGPFAQYGALFSIKYQMLAAAGYAVLAVNPRGSTGHGEAFAAALRDKFPGPDHEDLMDAVTAVSARADIDAGRLFITGVSGGGVLTFWGVAHDHRFRAGVSIKPVVDWQSWTLTADIGAVMGPRWLGDVLPWQDPAKYRARSPLTYATQVRTPTLFIGGEADSRTPDTEALQAYTALRMRGVPTAYLRLPGTSHSSTAMRPSHVAAECAAIIGWFRRYDAA